MMIPPKWREAYYLSGTITLQRLWNWIKQEISYPLSNWTKEPLLWSYPSSFSLEPTNYCNLNCPECPAGALEMKRDKGFISPQVYVPVIDQLAEHAMYLILYFQGEPFLHPQIFDIIQYARSKKLYVMISTNGHYLDKEKSHQLVNSGLHKLIVSLDGADQEAYEAYRKGGDINKVVQGIENVVEAKKQLNSRKPLIELQFLVLKTNEHQMEEVKRLSKKLNVDRLALKTAQIYNFKNGSPYIPETDKYSRYQKNDSGEYEIKMQMKNRCYRMWSGCVVTFDGYIVPCCFDKDASYAMGNIRDRSFKDIWKDENYRSFRKQILTNRKGIDMCRNCTEGLK
ncbi:MAG: SPASM domain-containing protein [Bacteroidales bacterium]|nr:SPASM domain-containing protein [Bacteroidales bacterium]